MQQLTDAVILGNHDAAAIGQTDLAFFNPDARRAAEWTAEQLDSSERQYLASLPLVLEQNDALFVHADPCQPAQWRYVHDLILAREALDAIDGYRQKNSQLNRAIKSRAVTQSIGATRQLEDEVKDAFQGQHQSLKQKRLGKVGTSAGYNGRRGGSKRSAPSF